MSSDNSKGSVFKRMSNVMSSNKHIDSLRMSIQESNVTTHREDKNEDVSDHSSSKKTVKIKDGFKLDPETGELVEMTAEEIKRKQINDDIIKVDKLAEKLEKNGKILRAGYQGPLSDYTELSSDDSMMATSRADLFSQNAASKRSNS